MARQCIILLLVLSLAACSTSGVPNTSAPSATRGLAYAQQVCAACHAVEAAQDVSPNRAAPTFMAIANLPGMTPAALNVWLHSAHASMPNLVVEPKDRADIAAYLDTLRRTGGTA